MPESKRQNPSKYYSMLCQTFIFHGHCPYKTRCIFLHPPEITSAHDIIIKPQVDQKKTKYSRDTFYWPDMLHNKMNMRESQTQNYTIPVQFSLTQSTLHNVAMYSMWYYFVDSLHAMDTQQNDNNKHIPWLKRLPVFVALSHGASIADVSVAATDKYVVDSPPQSLSPVSPLAISIRKYDYDRDHDYNYDVNTSEMDDFSSATSCGYNSFSEEEEDEPEDNVDEYWKNLKRVSGNCAELVLGEIDLDWFNDSAVSFVAPFRKSDYCKQTKETSEIMNSSHAHRIAGFKFTN
jgi:hypothetical protein